MAITLLNAIIECARRAGMLSAEGTATGGAAQTLIDTNALQHSTWDTSQLARQWLLRTNAASTNDTLRWISAYAPTTGTLTQDGAAWSNNPDSSATYAVLRTVPPSNGPVATGNAISWTDAINRTLRRMYHPKLTLLSMLADADMETSGVGSWTASNATLTKDTGIVGWGTQSLKVVTTLANGSAKQTINVQAGGSYTFTALVNTTAGNEAYLQVRDPVANEAIRTEREDRPGWRWRTCSFSVPDDIDTVELLLGVVENGGTAYFDMVSVNRTGSAIAKTNLTQADVAAGRLRGVRVITSITRPELGWDWFDGSYVARTDTSPVVLSNLVPDHMNGHILMLDHIAAYDEVTSLSGSIPLDGEMQDWLIEGACYEAFRALAAPSGQTQGLYRERMREHQDRFGKLSWKFQPPHGAAGVTSPNYFGPMTTGW